MQQLRKVVEKSQIIVTGERSSSLKNPNVPFQEWGCTLKVTTIVQLSFLADFSLPSLVKMLVCHSNCVKPDSLEQICLDSGIAPVHHKLAVTHLVPSSSDPEMAHSLN